MLFSKKIRRRLVSCFVFLAIIAALFWYVGVVFDRYARPALIGFINEQTDFEFSFEKISIGLSEFILKGLSIQKEESFSLTIPRVEIEFSFTQLSEKIFGRVVLIRPELVLSDKIFKAGPQGGSKQRNISAILDELLIEDGRLSYTSSAGQITASSLNGKIIPGGNYFNLSTVLASRELISFKLDTEGTWAGNGIKLDKVNLAEIEYLSEDELKALTGGGLKLSGKVNWEEKTFDFTANLGAEEVLYESFYADVSDQELRAIVKASYDWQESLTLRLDESQIVFPGLGKVAFEGSSSADKTDLRASLSLRNLQDSQKLLKKLLADSFEKISDLELSGSLYLDSKLSRENKLWKADALLRTKAFSYNDSLLKLSVKKLSGSLPLIYRTAGTGKKFEGARKKGRLSFSEVEFDSFKLNPGELKIISSANRIDLQSPLVFLFGDGKITADNFSLLNKEGKPAFKAAVVLESLKLEDFIEDPEAVPVSGKIAGKLGQISYSEGVLETKGKATLEVFSGKVEVENILAENVFDPYRTVSGDIRLEGINLYQLTKAFSFGAMHGVVNGEVKGLELLGLVPEAFQAKLSTVSKGKRRISVKALNNLSIISQGEAMAALSRGVYSLVDTYRYKKIGIECSLKNDVFKLYGTAYPGSRKYLIYGGLIPPKLDMVTYNPKISFKEMLRRLKRIKRSG